MKFPWSQAADPLGLPVGNYEVEVVGCEEKKSKKTGDMMWEIKLRSVAFKTGLCRDWIMLGGEGLNMGAAKLSALGFSKENDVEPGHLLGKRAWVATKEKPADGEYARQLQVDGKAKGANAGYFKEKPLSVVEPVVPVSDESSPF